MCHAKPGHYETFTNLPHSGCLTPTTCYIYVGGRVVSSDFVLVGVRRYAARSPLQMPADDNGSHVIRLVVETACYSQTGLAFPCVM